MTNDNTIGFHSLVENIKKLAITPFRHDIHDDSGSLSMETVHNPMYVQPLFSIINQFGDDGSQKGDAQIILISAVGATGKSALAKELSYELQCPIVDLGAAEVMAGSSLTGIIFKKLSPVDGANFVQSLQSGSATMIIDGLDEGFQRTKTQGFFDFLDDVKGMTSKTGKSFILLGRNNAIELAALHFSTKGVKTITYQIEPFTIPQAEQFIRLIMAKESGVDIYSAPYKDLLTYIIKSTEGFFKDHQDLKTNQYERFIGYAPVLLSIAEFLKKNKSNYQRVLSDFQKSQLKGVTLIINIVEGVLKRDKELKILPQLIDESIKGRSAEFQTLARQKAYGIDEQCARILYRCLNKPYTHPVTGDESFDRIYNQGIERWIDEHPFLSGRKIANTVFEGYILARLIESPLYRSDVDQYISNSTGISYMFFGIYQEMYKSKEYLDMSIVSYLYTSLKALDNKKKFYRLEFTYDEEDFDYIDSQERPCELRFEGDEDSGLPPYVFKTLISKKSCLSLHNYIGDVYIDVPISIEISSSRIVLSAPGYINCKSATIYTDEIVLARRTDEDKFVIEADNVELLTSKAYPEIISDKNSREFFNVVCDNTLSFPLNEYQSSLTQKCAKLTQAQKEYYKKLRRTLIMFRSHSKGEFAKVQSKIHSRIASKPDGKLVVEALLKKHIIYPKGVLYFIDKSKMNEWIGVKFDSLRTCVITDKVIKFLQNI